MLDKVKLFVLVAQWLDSVPACDVKVWRMYCVGSADPGGAVYC